MRWVRYHHIGIFTICQMRTELNSKGREWISVLGITSIESKMSLIKISP